MSFIYRRAWSIYRLPTGPEREPCQCNLATCYLIDGCREEIDKPFKRVVTWTKASCTLAHTGTLIVIYIYAVACAYTLRRIPLDSNRITIEIVKRELSCRISEIALRLLPPTRTRKFCLCRFKITSRVNGIHSYVFINRTRRRNCR